MSTPFFEKVIRARCPNSVHALEPPQFPDGWPDHVPLGGEQVRSALWHFGGNVTLAARHLRVNPTRLRRYVHEIETSLLDEIERIDRIIAEYAARVLEGTADDPTPPPAKVVGFRRAPSRAFRK